MCAGARLGEVKRKCFFSKRESWQVFLAELAGFSSYVKTTLSRKHFYLILPWLCGYMLLVYKEMNIDRLSLNVRCKLSAVIIHMHKMSYYVWNTIRFNGFIMENTSLKNVTVTTYFKIKAEFCQLCCFLHRRNGKSQICW